jgi:hypothetical protein
MLLRQNGGVGRIDLATVGQQPRDQLLVCRQHGLRVVHGGSGRSAMQPHPEAQNRRRHFLQRLQRAVIIGNTSISQMPVVLRR